MYIIYKYSDIRKENSPYSGTRRRQKVKKIVNLCLSTVGKLKSELAPAYLHLMTAKNHKNQLFLFSCLLKCNWLLLHFCTTWLGSHLAIFVHGLLQAAGPQPPPVVSTLVLTLAVSLTQIDFHSCLWGQRWMVCWSLSPRYSYTRGEAGGGRKCWIYRAGTTKIYYFPVSGWRGEEGPVLQWELQQLQRGSILHLTTLRLQPAGPPPPPGHTKLSKQTHFYHIENLTPSHRHTNVVPGLQSRELQSGELQSRELQSGKLQFRPSVTKGLATPAGHLV